MDCIIGALVVTVILGALVIRTLERLTQEHGTQAYNAPADDRDTQPEMWWYTTRRLRPDGTLHDFPGYREDS